ncbi:hypothetical protein AB0C65_36090 [Nocardia sp. NPDC048505]|uniref:hypothetical protein n=1 Tax=Nocardia sp. NPDC048505 TaxID=3155756 RepID=UPI0034050D7B
MADNNTVQQPPKLTAADIIGGRDQVNHVTIAAERHGVQLRYVLRVDHYLNQSRFIVEGFSKVDLGWKVLWSITPNTYAYIPGPADRSTTDPNTNRIANPADMENAAKAASWQKIINALTEHADRLLS